VWHPRLIAPLLQRHVPKRAAESNFILMLQLAYLNLTGRDPAFTARHNALGRFPLFAIACLKLVSPDANTIEIINELQRRRLEVGTRMQLRSQLRRDFQELELLQQAIETIDQLLEA
jgi:hypothetical protein